jgi:hypothetical protein
MGIPIGELQGRVTSREFAEYMAFHELEPFGPEREDLRAGIVASTIANANRDPKKHGPYTADDFMPRYGAADVDDEPDEEELAAKIERAFAALGGPVTTGSA